MNVLDTKTETIREKNNVFLSHKKTIVSVLVIVFFLAILFYLFNNSHVENKDSHLSNKVSNIELVSEKRVNEYNNNYYESAFKNSPISIQNAFLEDVKNGVNNMYTKSDAYFIMHRFFDNGGNIYEIYDYVNNHPELSFLQKDAEVISGKAIDLVRKRDPSVMLANDLSYYVYLAYVEALINRGYYDVAMTGTAANQYAKLAYFATENAKEMPKEEGLERTKYVKRDVAKSAKFLVMLVKDINDILGGKITSEDIPARDILVGLNQSAAALRYLEALGFDLNDQEAKAYMLSKGINPSSVRTSKEIFAFSVEYSHENVPELVLFTSLLNASTLALSEKSTSEEIRNALYPILDFDTKKFRKDFNLGIISKIIDTRFEKSPKSVADTNMDIYGKRNTLILAKKVPEFKKWLMYNGWSESDFKY